MNKLAHKFNIGDVVKLNSSGGAYEFYYQAFEHFGILNYCTKEGAYVSLKLPVDYKDYRWIVKGIAIHENKTVMLYLLASIETHQFIVYSACTESNCIELDTKFPQYRTDNIRERYKDYVIREITRIN